MSHLYGLFRNEETLDKKCPISLKTVTVTDETHPREHVFISDRTDLRPTAYDVTTFNDFVKYFDKQNPGCSITIPHINLEASYVVARAIRKRLLFHMDALSKHPDMSIKILREESKDWVKLYLTQLSEGNDCSDLKSKIYYFCQPSNFDDYFLNDEKNNRETALKIIKEQDIVGGCILRKTSIVDTHIVQNFALTIVGSNMIRHIPFRHRFGFGYYIITTADSNSTIDKTIDEFIGPSLLDIFDYLKINLKNLIKIR